MIKILNSANETQAMLENITISTIQEEINGEFKLNFSTIIDNDKSAYVNYQYKAEVESNYFNIVYTEENRIMEGLYIRAECEHVSYDLISATFTAGFTATGLFSAVATTLLVGTGFTIGTNEITASQTINVNESTNARNVLFQLATLYGGELEFDKYQINLLIRRGADLGVQFRYRKNLVSANRIVDNRTKTITGLPTISYGIDVAELEFEQGYIASGADANEHYELGDTITVFDADLNINTQLRIVKESHNTEQRMQGTVELGNFIKDISHIIDDIQKTQVSKDNIYNGCSIGPDNGFVAERSDGIAKTLMNATNGHEIALRNTTTASYTPVFYVQIDTATSTAKLYLAGNAVFTGQVLASEFIGGSILIGATAFATAPFSVTASGAATADNLLLTGGVIQVGTSNNTFRFNESTGLWMGNTTFGSAPFSVAMSGALTATSAEINGRFTTKSTANITLMDIYQDTEGGKIQINDNVGNANVRLGVEAGTGDNVGGTLILYNDGVTKPRIALGTLTSDDVGIFEALDGNEIVRIQIQGYNSTYSSSFIGIRDSAQTLKTYLLETSGYINNVQIATQAWAAQAGTSTGSHVQGNHDHGIPNGTVLQTVTGTITWVESGGFSHSHTQT